MQHRKNNEFLNISEAVSLAFGLMCKRSYDGDNPVKTNSFINRSTVLSV
jgi:hypothetical protein